MKSEILRQEDGEKMPHVVSKETLIGYLDSMGLTTQLTDQEKSQYLEICGAYGLNPFKKEIHVMKYGDNFSIVIGYETYLKRAERSGLLDGWSERTEGSVKENNLRAIITIYRKDRTHPFIHEVDYEEYVQNTKEGKPNKFWREKPKTMLKKVVRAQGFRMFFSEDLGGMPYTAEEIANEATYELLDSKINNNESKDESVNIDDLTIAKAITDMELCENITELQSVWLKYKAFQGNPLFSGTKDKRKAELANVK